METRQIDGIRVLMPSTPEELTTAMGSGEPFHAPEELARDFGLPRDPHLVDDEDVGVLDNEEDA